MSENKSRVYMLDILRGIAVLGMVFHHALVSAEIVFETSFEFLLTTAFEVVQLIFVMVFLLVSGICTNYSRSIVRRGAVVTAAALIVSFATCVVMPMIGLDGLSIYFGILHMFGLSMLIYGLCRKLFEKIPPLWGIIIFTVLFFAYYAFYKTNPSSEYYSLVPFGVSCVKLPPQGDYYPLFPFFFMFMTGTYLGKYVKQRKFPEFFYEFRFKPLEFCGKYSLLVYIIHQPIIFGTFYLISMIMANS